MQSGGRSAIIDASNVIETDKVDGRSDLQMSNSDNFSDERGDSDLAGLICGALVLVFAVTILTCSS